MQITAMSLFSAGSQLRQLRHNPYLSKERRLTKKQWKRGVQLSLNLRSAAHIRLLVRLLPHVPNRNSEPRFHLTDGSKIRHIERP